MGIRYKNCQFSNREDTKKKFLTHKTYIKKFTKAQNTFAVKGGDAGVVH